MTDQDPIRTGLPQSWAREEVTAAFGISEKKLTALIKDGRVGFIVGRNRKPRFMAEHIGQIREAIEVKPAGAIDPDIYARIGVTRRAVRRRGG